MISSRVQRRIVGFEAKTSLFLPACIVELIVILDGHSGQSELTTHCRAFLAATRVGKGAFGARQLLCGES